VTRTAQTAYTLESWKDPETQDASIWIEQQILALDRITVVRCAYRPGSAFPAHSHPHEQVTIVEEGALVFRIDGQDVEVPAGRTISIAAHARHATRVRGPAVRAVHLFLGGGGPKTAR
jgi:quercetin dioxygenase-like cupin family protein